MNKTVESKTSDAAEKSGRAAAKKSNAQALAAANLLFQAPDFSSFTAENGDATHETAKKTTRTRQRQRNSSSENDEKDNTSEAKIASESKKSSETKKNRRKNDDSSDNAAEKVAKSSDKGDSTSIDSGETATTTKRKRSRTSKTEDPHSAGTATENEVTRRHRRRIRSDADAENDSQVQALEGSTRLEAKRIRRKAGRKEGRKRTPITESEFLARRDSVKREMVVRGRDGLNQVALLEDGLLVEHYVSRHTQTTMVGNVYLGKVQNVLSSMEAAFVDIGKGRNAVLYAGEVNWDAAGLNSKTGRIEEALSPGDMVLVQVTKDPIGHKGARLTSQITLAGRHLVLVPSGAMTGISRKLPEEERKRLKTVLKTMIPAGFGVIVRTAAEGATEEQLRVDVERLVKIWEDIEKKRARPRNSPQLLHAEPELAVRVVRDIFNEDISSLTIQGEEAWHTISKYVKELSPELGERLHFWEDDSDVFAAHRIDEQLAKGFERKVWLPSGGYLIIDRTEAMTVIDVNTGRYIGAGGTLEETVTKNNLEAAEEIVRQLRLRDIGGIVVIDFVDMVIESNRDLVLRRLVECLGRDRTRHQVTEVTSLGLVQMTRKRVGQGLVEAFSTQCECCDGRGFIVHDVPVENNGQAPEDVVKHSNRRGSSGGATNRKRNVAKSVKETKPEVRQTMAGIAAAAHAQEEPTESQATTTKGKSGAIKKTKSAGGVQTSESSEITTAADTDTAIATKAPTKTTAKKRSAKELERAKEKPALTAGEAKREITSSAVPGTTPTRRRHRRAVSTGVINTDSTGADIVVSGN
ncbi:Rne/Rng family ribonuclease [Mobiluncus mulieris]|uniref:Rne/Rng family ribonuclease n=1 Tax=Mobiluncus mulieris TaxID=2052 RepID=UPI0014704C0C|nr:Rne/Rng family ribonuclease [Mobiluncus mulieris]